MNRTALKSAPAPAAALLDHHDQLARQLPGRQAEWLSGLRTAALARYRAQGLPGRRDEAWRYTVLTHLAELAPLPARLAAEPPPLELPTEIPVVDGCKLVMVNGQFDRLLCDLDRLPKGAVVESLAAALQRHPDALKPWLGVLSERDDAPLAALNTASFDDGVVIRLAAGTVLEEPLHLISVGVAVDRPVAFHPRLLLVLEDGAQATVVESHAGVVEQPYLSNAVAEVHLGRNAVLRHYKVQDEAPLCFHLGLCGVRVAEGARYESALVQVGARLGRQETRVVLAGRNAECRLDGAYVGDGDQVLDNVTVVEHCSPAGKSRQLWKGVLDGKARGIYQGKVQVARAAQKTDAHQLSKALLLSPGAEMDGKPELEIFADDVKCGHGATVGELDEHQLFYLESRGIDREEARRLLIEAFVTDVLDNVSDDRVRGGLATLLRHRLDRRR